MRFIEGERKAAANDERRSEERAVIAQELSNLKDTIENMRLSQDSNNGNAENNSQEAH
jgi:hypothetical protein